MRCLFKHRWDGCVCSKCGEKRDEAHDFQREENGCQTRCARCGKVGAQEHQADAVGLCGRCGDYVFTLRGLFSSAEEAALTVGVGTLPTLAAELFGPGKKGEAGLVSFQAAYNTIGNGDITLTPDMFPPLYSGMMILEGLEDAQTSKNPVKLYQYKTLFHKVYAFKVLAGKEAQGSEGKDYASLPEATRRFALLVIELALSRAGERQAQYRHHLGRLLESLRENPDTIDMHQRLMLAACTMELTQRMLSREAEPAQRLSASGLSEQEVSSAMIALVG